MSRRPANRMRPTGGREYTTGKIYPTYQDGYDKWIFTIPNGIDRNSFIELQVTNHSNAQCGVYKCYLRGPDGTETEKQTGVQPAIVARSMVGKWKLFIKQTELCRPGGEEFGITVTVRY